MSKYGWTSETGNATANVSANEWATNDTTNYLDVYSEDGDSIDISYAIERRLPAGTYKATISVSGEFTNGLTFYVNGTEVSETTSVSAGTAWDTWTTYEIEFTLTEEAAEYDIVIGISGDLESGNYVDLDDLKLYYISGTYSLTDTATEYEITYFTSTLYNYNTDEYNAATQALAGEAATTSGGSGGTTVSLSGATVSSSPSYGSSNNGYYGIDSASSSAIAFKSFASSQVAMTVTYTLEMSAGSYNLSAYVDAITEIWATSEVTIYPIINGTTQDTAIYSASFTNNNTSTDYSVGTESDSNVTVDTYSAYNFTVDSDTSNYVIGFYIVVTGGSSIGATIGGITLSSGTGSTSTSGTYLNGIYLIGDDAITEGDDTEDTLAKYAVWNMYTGWDYTGSTITDGGTGENTYYNLFVNSDSDVFGTTINDLSEGDYSRLVKTDISDSEDGDIFADGMNEAGLFTNNTTYEDTDGNVYNIKDIYTNVGIPYYVTDDGYYIFDSDLYDAYFAGGEAANNTNLEINFDKKIMGADSSDEGGYDTQGFFPFDGEDDTVATYHFGMKTETDFLFTEDGTVNGEDMTFEFSGDDDVYVYIDGNLVLDISGIHDAITASIDFATGECYIYEGQTDAVVQSVSMGEYYASLAAAQLASTGIESVEDNGDGTYTITYDETMVHTLSIYYLERGEGASNAMIKYNLIPYASLTVEKQAGEKLTTVLGEDYEYDFVIQEYDENDGWVDILGSTDYELYDENGDLVGTYTTDSDGTFKLKDGYKAVFTSPLVGKTIRVVENDNGQDTVTTSTGGTVTTYWSASDGSTSEITTGKISSSHEITTAAESSTQATTTVADIENSSLNQATNYLWNTTFDSEITGSASDDGVNYYYRVENSEGASSVTGTISREISGSTAGKAYTVSLQVRSSVAGETGMTLTANGIDPSVSVDAADTWETITIDNVVADDDGVISIVLSGTIAAGATFDVDDLSVVATTDEDSDGTTYTYTAYNMLTPTLEYYVWLGNEAAIEIGSDISESDSDLEFTTAATITARRTSDTNYSATLSGSMDDDDFTLTYLQSKATGDYTYDLTEDTNSIMVIIHVYDTEDDIFVLDYGLSVSLSDTTYDNGLFYNDTLDTSNTATTALYEGVKTTDGTDYGYDDLTLTNGTVTGPSEEAELDSSSMTATDITYTPTAFISSIDELDYQVRVQDSGTTSYVEYKTGVTMNASAQIMPAESVYYEDNFATITYSGTTSTDGTSSDSSQSNSLTTQYGYGEAYADDSTYSNGSATIMTADGVNTYATFKFTGTGFDIYARTNSSTATVYARVYSGTDTTGTPVATKVVNTFYQNGDLYQIPVLTVSDLSYDTYTVMLYAIATSNQTVIYFDGVRIYNPLGTSANATADYTTATSSDGYLLNEINATYSEVRGLILGTGYTTTSETDEASGDTTYTVEAGSGVAASLVTYDSTAVTVGSGGTTVTETFEDISSGTTGDVQSVSDYYTYLVSGPNNETYLASNYAVAVTVNGYDSTDDTYTFQVGAKAASGSAELTAVVLDTVEDESGTSTQAVATTVETIETATEMYYVITMPESATDDCVVLLMNTGTGTLSLTDIKTNGYTYLKSDSEYGQDISYTNSVAYTVANYLASITNSGDDTTDTSTETLTNSALAQTSSVVDSKYSLRFIGIIDSLDYDTVGFLITLYDEDGNVLSEEDLKMISTVYTSIKANGVTYYADATNSGVTSVAGDANGYIYTYTYKNIPTGNVYYFSVANYTNSTSGTEAQSEYKYYKLAGDGTVSVVTEIPTTGGEE